MLTDIRGYYEDGKVIPLEDVPAHSKSEVIIRFFSEDTLQKKERVPGSLKGKIWITDDFNEPLDDLKDYM
jgi:hypothetical protein